MVMRAYTTTAERSLTRAPFFFFLLFCSLEYWKRERKVGEREKLAKQEIKAVPFTDTEVFPLFDLSQNRSLLKQRRTKTKL